MAHRKVHLVGSVPLGSSRKVLEATSAYLSNLLLRYSDGETETNKGWVRLQRRLVAENPDFEPSDTRLVVQDRVYDQFRIKRGVAPRKISFAALGFAEQARRSYGEFCDLRNAGAIQQKARFLVTFPAPAAFLNSFIDPAHRSAVERPYVEGLFDELQRIMDAVPRSDLAVQWDVVHEILAMEGAFDYFAARDELLSRIAELGERIPEPVDVGFHFCYGYLNRKHEIEPRSVALMVEIANALTDRMARSINFVHMPVPRNRSDRDYFAPLRDVRLRPETELYLGLIHLTDGIAGTGRRITAAAAVLPEFGIATECGFGNRPPETIPRLLELHVQAATGS
jgi:hypothetical protein